MQNAEQLQESLAQLATTLKDTLKSSLLDAIDDNIECADAIMQCALAQKHVADDILSYGAIGASRYSISAVEVPLLKHVRTTLKMFTTECKAKKIDLDLVVESRVRRMATIEADPTRLMQILINLLSNAIRFTQRQKERKITVTLDASTASLTTEGRLSMPFEQSHTPSSSDIEPGRPFYLYCSVVCAFVAVNRLF